MSMSDLIDPAFSSQLCLTLLHSIWQVVLVTLVAVLLDRLWKKQSPERSYTLHITALVIALVAMPVTWLVVESTNEANVAPISPVVSPLSMAVDVPVVKPGNIAEVAEHAVAGPHSQQQSTTSTTVVLSANSTVATSALTPATVEPSSAIWRRFAMWIVACYVIGVIAMFGRLAIAMKKAHRLAAIARPITDESLLSIIQTLAQNWSMKVVPVLAHAKQVFVPQVVGLLRPTILLPASAMSGLSVDELELILTHEVAHIRRYDMWAALIQRLAESILFFNPAIWYLNRRISELREYCCDDIACKSQSVSDPPAHIRYAHALLRVVELGHPNASANPQLAALAASGRSPSELRRRVTRLFGEPMHEPLRLSRGGFLTCVAVAGLMLVGPALLPQVNHENTATAANPDPDEAKSLASKPDSSAAEIKSSPEFRLNLVGPSGAPVANALVSIRSNPPITTEQIQRGTFDRKHNYGVYVKTDERGQLIVSWSRSAGHIVFDIEQPGFGPYWAEWNSRDLPGEHTAELEAAWTVGGIVVDEAGKPIADAAVCPTIEFKKRPGDSKQLRACPGLKTDSNGRWKYDSVPASKDFVEVTISHPQYAPECIPLPRSEYEVKDGASPGRQVQLRRGITITGRVVDDAGFPIEDALVRVDINDEFREVKTDKDGAWSIIGCQAGMATIVASVKGRAMELQEVRVDPDLKPVDFTLQPGRHIRIRVVEESGKGLAGSRILFRRWRGRSGYFVFDHVNEYADENGVWEWNEAPLDEFTADICPPGGMNLFKQPLKARDEEYVFTPAPLLVATGNVVDAKTGMPIEKFRVIPGIVNDYNKKHIWINDQGYTSSNGTYRMLLALGEDCPAYLVRIEADNYKAAVSRDIKLDEGAITLDFALESAGDLSATVLTPSNEPASGAKAVLADAGSQVSIKNGEFDSVLYATRMDADAGGRITTRAVDGASQVVVLHESGFAHVKSTEGKLPDPIQLTSWAIAQGTFLVGREAVSGARIELSSVGIHSDGKDVPRISSYQQAITGNEGRFSMERVFPGKTVVRRSISVVGDYGATESISSCSIPCEFVSGQTTTCDLGGTGVKVIGRLLPPDDHSEKIIWGFATLYAGQDLKSSPAAWTTINPDGSFRIDDMPAGKYVLTLRFDDKAPGELPDVQFTVPVNENAANAGPLDLGDLMLQKQADKSVDAAAREFRLKVVGPDGAPVANAILEIRGNQSITAEQIEQGKYVKENKYGVAVATDEHGKLTLNWAHTAGHIGFHIETPGYGPYCARWNPESMPTEFTAELDAAWSVGGIIVDDAGHPIEDATVSPSVEFKKPPGDTSQLGVGDSVKTDSDGKWRYDMVPVSSDKDYVYVSIDHPNHQPQRLPLPRSEYEIKADVSPNRRITLKTGVTITGNVTDDSGNPIEGATVRTRFVNEVREAKTDAAGTYEIGGCEPRMTRIVAFAEGRAMELQEVLVDPKMKPIDFMLNPGGHVRIKVVDENGKGLAKSRIFFKRWRGHIDSFEFDHVKGYADENGIWEWDEAPLDEFQADICRPDGMQLTYRPITARTEEYVFNPPPALVVSGHVIDAKTKEPVKGFRIVPGTRDEAGQQPGEHWSMQDSEQSVTGKYRISRHREAPAHMLRIEAPGYKVAVSRNIKTNEGAINIDFELEPAKDISSVVLSPDGTSAAGAQIALGGPGDQISVKNGVFDGQTYATRFVTDTEGRFNIPERSTPFQLVILHDNGFAHLNSADGPIPFEITLTPWARVQGTFRVGNTVMADVPISVYGSVFQSWRDESNPSIFSRIEFKTDSEGRFEFDRITPGLWRIGRNITMMADDGATEVTSAQHVATEFVAGTTTAVTLGGVGRPLVGKLIPPDGTELPNWKFALLMVNADLVQPSLPESMSVETPNETEAERAVRWDTWEKTDEGKTWSAAYRAYRDEEDRSTQFRATIDRDGSFRIDDMPAGNYVLTMPFDDKAPGKLPEFHFTVPTVEDGTQPEPLDLGNLQLEKKMATP